MKTQDNRAYKLLKKWVDALLKYRIDNINNHRLKGSFICPACGIVHGRCFDLVLSLCYLYKYEKDEKYLTAAREVMDFSEVLRLRDGTYFNDFAFPWYGISAFYADCLGETLETSGDALPKDFYDRVEKEFLSWEKISVFVFCIPTLTLTSTT